jgi:hypothetical protein
MSNNPFEPSKAEMSARKVAKFLIELPTNDIPGFVSQIPPAHLSRVVASMEAYTIRAALVTAYVQAIVSDHSLSEASGKAAKVSRAVRRAFRSVPDEPHAVAKPPGELRNAEVGIRKAEVATQPKSFK